MCLDTIDETTSKWTSGWKIFRKDKYDKIDELRPAFQSLAPKFIINKWNRDKKKTPIKRIKSINNGSVIIIKYPSGFHFYRYKEDAIKYSCKVMYYDKAYNIILPIKVKNMVASGTQNYMPVGVANDIFIFETKKNRRTKKCY